MRKTAAPVAVSLAAVIACTIGLFLLFDSGRADVGTALGIRFIGMVLPAVLAAIALTVLLDRRRIVVPLVVAGGAALTSVYSAGFALDIDIADGSAAPNVLSQIEGTVGLLGVLWWIAATIIILRPLFRAAGMGPRVAWGLAIGLSPIVSIGLFILFLTPLLWAASAAVLVVSVAQTPYSVIPATPVGVRATRPWAIAAIVILLVVWAPLLTISIATTGTDAASIALGRGLGGSQLAGIPVLVCATLLFAPRGHRGVRAALLVASGTVAVESVAWFIAPVSDGNLAPVLILLSAVGPGALAAAIVMTRVRMPLVIQIVAGIGVALAGAAIWATSVFSAGTTVAVVAIVLLVLAREPRLSPAPRPVSP